MLLPTRATSLRSRFTMNSFCNRMQPMPDGVVWHHGYEQVPMLAHSYPQPPFPAETDIHARQLLDPQPFGDPNQRVH